MAEAKAQTKRSRLLQDEVSEILVTRDEINVQCVCFDLKNAFDLCIFVRFALRHRVLPRVVVGVMSLLECEGLQCPLVPCVLLCEWANQICPFDAFCLNLMFVAFRACKTHC